MGLHDYQARNLAVSMGMAKEHWGAFTKIAHALYRVYVKSDATLAEINPLVITKSGMLLALDGKIVLDDNALFRQTELAEMRDVDEEVAAEREARKFGLSYVKLDGTIGCLVNGAGLAMATMDVIKHLGGNPANFLDIGGGAAADKVAAAIRIILSDPEVTVVLINIFGGITRCDEVARGILMAIEQIGTKHPMVVRLVGTNEEQGRRLLSDADMLTASSLVDAAQQAIQISKEMAST
jgi:succinyl-CoA synthetase beta subunit